MIIVGTVEDIVWGSGSWIFLDIGFSNSKRSCGVAIGSNEPVEMRFNDAVATIIQHAKTSSEAVNLVIEAPLSVAFDSYGNPKGRRIEKLGKKTRYWYNGPGCAVMVAALYVVRALNSACPTATIRLFEGFVSFKNRSAKSSNSEDVERLRQVVRNRTHIDSIVEPSALKMNTDDKLASTFEVAGLQLGIPPVIKV